MTFVDFIDSAEYPNKYAQDNRTIGYYKHRFFVDAHSFMHRLISKESSKISVKLYTKMMEY